MKVQENQEGLKLNGRHQLLVHVDIILLHKNKNPIKKNTAPLDTSKKVGWDISKQRQHNVDSSLITRYRTIIITNKSIVKCSKSKIFGLAVTNQNCIQKDIYLVPQQKK
jgi:hypothetical protein